MVILLYIKRDDIHDRYICCHFNVNTASILTQFSANTKS